MQVNHRILQVISVFVVSLFIFSVLHVPTATAATNSDDGIWTDDFNNKDSTTLHGCTWESSGYIHLNTSSGHTYDYGDGNSHTASYYRSFFSPMMFPFLFSPTLHRGIDFLSLGYAALEGQGEDQNRYVNTSTASTFWARYAVQLFRFKLDVDADNAGDITVTWKGKAQNPSSLTLCYWKKPSDLLPGRWVPINSTSKDDTYLTLQGTIDKNDTQYAVDTDRYFSVCVILKTPSGVLSTDYIKIKSLNEQEYNPGPGYITSKYNISLSGDNPYWELLTWESYRTDQTPISVQVLVENSTYNWNPVSDDILPGNVEGFKTSPVYLNTLPYSSIRLRANLSTNDTTQSPELYSWSLVWQQDKTQWQDLFSSEFRIDTKHYLSVNGKVNISTVIGEWPMAGQNPANTRAAEGRGPQTDALYWYSTIHESTSVQMPAPVLDGDTLYLSYTNAAEGKGYVYKYSPITVDTGNVGLPFARANTKNFTHYSMQPCVVSPAVTDNYLIVPEGQTGSGGVQNYIYFFTKNAPTATPITYKNDRDLCYWASPIVVGHTLYITTWSGDIKTPTSNANNMILAVDFISNLVNPKWNQTLPAWSYSTPAYSDGIVVAGCHNESGPSLFAYNASTGHPIWSADVGAIDRASPVIVDGVVYIVSEVGTKALFSEQTQVTALHLNNGTRLWNTTLGKTKVHQDLLTWDANNTLADCTPAYADGVLYITTPDGQLDAVNVKSGTVTWTKSVYTYSRNGPTLKSSPAFADDTVFIGTPNGTMAAYQAGNGTRLWANPTYSTDQSVPSVVSNPVVSNGLVFYCAANGWVFCFGGYIAPNEKLAGSLITIPIQLPTNYWWNRFFVNDNTTSGKSNITYSLLTSNKTLLRTLKDGDSLLMTNTTLPRTIRLQAEFQAKNYTVNPSLFNWSLTFTTDVKKPFINKSSLQPLIPKGGWIHSLIPKFYMMVKDNDTGLLVSSASFTLDYYRNSTLLTVTHPASCAGTNGTKAWQNFTANLSQWPEYRNITRLDYIIFSISDLAGNTASYSIEFNQDPYKPRSWVYKGNIHTTYTSKYLSVNATATDNISGVASVTLAYRASPSDPWQNYSTLGGAKPVWNITFPSGGHYELMSRATDKAGNVEDVHATADANLTYDATPPDFPELESIYWFRDIPTFSITFQDDYLLNTIQYRPNFVTDDWTDIASHINQSTYTAEWTLPEPYWNIMTGNQSYYLFFRINDTLGNTRTITNTSDALQMRRDTEKPTVTISLPSQATFHNADEHFNITAVASDVGGSGIQALQLLYRYSTDGNNWTGDWTQYGANLSIHPYIWDFAPPNGEGYYQFQIVATDRAGNVAESTVMSTGVQVFPTTWLIVLGALVVLFVIMSIALLVKWRKR